VNEYTRREEIRWTLGTVFILVPAVAAAIGVLVYAEGPMVTNPASIRAEAAARKVSESFKGCHKNAKDLAGEVGVFRSRAAQAQRAAVEKAPKRRWGRKTKAPEFEIPWSAASPVLKQVAALAKNNCRALAARAASPSADAGTAWKAVSQAAAIAAPGRSPKARQSAAKKLLFIFAEAPVRALGAHTKKASSRLANDLEEATETREDDLVRSPLPEGLFARGAAIGLGVAIALAALIISYISVRSASVRRGKALMALRPLANTEEAGMQAAAIVRLAAHHNGGEPGMAMGAALGGLLAVLLAPSESATVFIADLFVAGTMGGVLFGLLVQWLVRRFEGASRFRERAKELGDIEKPTISIDLVINAVTPGHELDFLRYFSAQPMMNASVIVQKLAAQAEDQILAAADAAAQPQAAPPQAAPPQAAPPQEGGQR
jgi:hypothetical protein